MVNVRAAANRFTSAVNPNITVTYRASAGYTTDASFKQVPAYAPDVQVQAQLQPISNGDLQKIDGLNVQNVKSKLYLNGAASAVVRRDAKGGDIFIVNGATYLVEKVVEDWPNWCSLAIVEQTDT